MAKKKSSKKKEENKYILASLENVRYCTNCGRASIMQQPQHTAEGLVTCSRCQVVYRVQIPK